MHLQYIERIRNLYMWYIFCILFDIFNMFYLPFYSHFFHKKRRTTQFSNQPRLKHILHTRIPTKTEYRELPPENCSNNFFMSACSLENTSVSTPYRRDHQQKTKAPVLISFHYRERRFFPQKLQILSV